METLFLVFFSILSQKKKQKKEKKTQIGCHPNENNKFFKQQKKKNTK